MNLLLHLSRQYPQKGRGTVFLIINFAFVTAVLKVGEGPMGGCSIVEWGWQAGTCM
jgi:hypothetical protein